MQVNEIKTYLEKELPDFKFIAGTETPHEENWNSIRIVRDGKELVLDVSKVENKKHAKKLKEFIELKWRGVK
jgi:hypothetical protein